MKKYLVAASLVAVMSGPAFAVTDDHVTHIDVQNTMIGLLSTSSENAQSNGYNGGYNPAVVPLPAAGWMLLAGLGGLVALRRRANA